MRVMTMVSPWLGGLHSESFTGHRYRLEPNYSCGCRDHGRLSYRCRGLGRARSGGLKQGVVIQIDSVVDALVRSVAEANQMAGTKLTDPLVSVGGSHILGQDISGTVMLNHREVTDILLTQAMEQVQAQAQVPEREILSVIPRSFTLDSQTGIRLPQGMTGNRLDAHVHVITGATHVINNLKKCLKLAGLEVSVLVPSALAVSQLVLPDERELGVCVADIGIGTIDVMVIQKAHPPGCK